jgi:hypothetical protein
MYVFSVECTACACIEEVLLHVATPSGVIVNVYGASSLLGKRMSVTANDSALDQDGRRKQTVGEACNLFMPQ